jgi:hypothetical protein
MLDGKAGDSVANRHGCDRRPHDWVVIVPFGWHDPHDVAFVMIDRGGVAGGRHRQCGDGGRE